MIVICEAIKLDGLQCTNKGVECHEGAHLCRIHYKKRTKVITTKEVEPWVTQKLPTPYEANGARVIQKIRSLLRKGPKKNDATSGHIYVYYLAREQTLSYWKVGVTNRSVGARLKEWRQERNQRDIVLECSYKLERGCKYVERLIHLYLAYCRMARYPHKTGFHSVWYMDPSVVVNDGQQQEEGDSGRLSPRAKLTEWFSAPLRDILDIIEPLVLRCCRVNEAR